MTVKLISRIKYLLIWTSRMIPNKEKHYSNEISIGGILFLWLLKMAAWSTTKNISISFFILVDKEMKVDLDLKK